MGHRAQHDRVLVGRSSLGLFDVETAASTMAASIARTLEQRRKEAAKSAKASGRERR